jgi:hypothetical protein
MFIFFFIFFLFIVLTGGLWSASLDGGDPASDANVLVKTAIRHFKEKFAVDLSSCDEWTKICDIHYNRPGKGKLGKKICICLLLFLVGLFVCLFVCLFFFFLFFGFCDEDKNVTFIIMENWVF